MALVTTLRQINSVFSLGMPKTRRVALKHVTQESGETQDSVGRWGKGGGIWMIFVKSKGREERNRRQRRGSKEAKEKVSFLLSFLGHPE